MCLQKYLTSEEDITGLTLFQNGLQSWANIHAILITGKNDPDPFQNFIHEAKPKVQHLLAEQLHKLLRKTILDEVVERFTNRLSSAVGKGCSGFLTAIPYCKPTTLSNIQMEIAVKRRLGLPLATLISEKLLTCNCGTSNEIDQFGDHFRCCRKGNERFQLHFGLVHTFAAIFREAEIVVQTERALAA